VKGRRLGEGSEGVVYAARENSRAGDESGEAYALKSLNSTAAAAHEHNLLALLLPHPHVVAAHEVVLSPTAAFLVLEAAACDLRAYLIAHSATGRRLSVPQVKRVLLDVAAGVAHCHRHCIVHRDLKPSNCLLTRDGRIALGDFGHARMVPCSSILPSCDAVDEHDVMHDADLPYTPGTFSAPDTPRGAVRCAAADATSGQALCSGGAVCTLWYRAPELLLGADAYGSPIDAWSLGCIFAELLLLRPLLRGRDPPDQISLMCDVFGLPAKDEWPDLPRTPALSHMRAHARLHSVPADRRTLRHLVGMRFTSEATPLSHAGIALLESLLTLPPARRASASAVAVSPYLREEPFAAQRLSVAPSPDP